MLQSSSRKADQRVRYTLNISDQKPENPNTWRTYNQSHTADMNTQENALCTNASGEQAKGNEKFLSKKKETRSNEKISRKRNVR